MARANGPGTKGARATVVLPVAGEDRSVELEPSKIIALGLNYEEHVRESVTEREAGRTSEVPEEPVLFPKTPNTLIGHGEAIRIPRFLARYGFSDPRTDYEAELALVIGRRCRDVPAREALDVVRGFTCMNDVSQRNVQKGDRSGWFRGKSFDTFGPIGPVLVPPGSLSNFADLRITARLNGSVVQDARTSAMIFSVPEIIEFVSSNFTLEAGDIIVTGTPSGVGPLHHGDRIEIEIEGIGVLSNPVIDETVETQARETMR